MSDALPSPSLAAFDPGPGAEPPLCSNGTTNFPGPRIVVTRSQRSRFKRQEDRKRKCGKVCYPVKHLCGRKTWIRFRCRVRTCPECGDAYREEKTSRFRPLARYDANSRDRRVRFMTLTFKNVSWETADDCRVWIRERTEKLRLFLTPHLCRCCRWRAKPCECASLPERTKYPKCRRCRESLRGCDDPQACARVAWRVRGYLATWEVTEGRDGKFHPHLHLLVASAFIPWRQLRKHWEHWFGSWSCDVRAVKDGPQAFGYVLKYIGKAWPIGEEVQLVGFYRTKRLTSQGDFYGAKLAALLMHGSTQATGDERKHVRLCCEHCGIPQPRGAALVANERCSRARGSPCARLHGPPTPQGFRVCGHWRCPNDFAPFGRAWVVRGEWSNAGDAEYPADLPDMAEAAQTIALDWTGSLLWDEPRPVKLPSLTELVVLSP